MNNAVRTENQGEIARRALPSVGRRLEAEDNGRTGFLLGPGLSAPTLDRVQVDDEEVGVGGAGQLRSEAAGSRSGGQEVGLDGEIRFAAGHITKRREGGWKKISQGEVSKGW